MGGTKIGRHMHGDGDVHSCATLRSRPSNAKLFGYPRSQGLRTNETRDEQTEALTLATPELRDKLDLEVTFTTDPRLRRLW